MAAVSTTKAIAANGVDVINIHSPILAAIGARLRHRQGNQEVGRQQQLNLWCPRKVNGEPKSPCNSVAQVEIQKKVHAGRGQETKWEIPVHVVF